VCSSDLFCPKDFAERQAVNKKPEL